jgi:protein O-mannosyl-transferase
MAKKHNKKKSILPIATNHNMPTMDTPVKKRAMVKWQTVMVALLLAFVTVVVYSGVLKNDFDYFDDEYYVTTNNHVLQGLSLEGVRWAFTSVGYADNWHPLTWVSHMIDVQLFGLNPAGHHFMNLLFHILATLLLFGFLRYATGKLWTSAFVAALFALHPMHVESVAWVAERKDVLSAAFCFATLWAYAYYARAPKIGRYVIVLILFALGLLAKPMLVTLPFILLLLDYWPLERLTVNTRTIGKLVAEKLPLLTMAAASSIITVVAQHTAIGSVDRYYLSTRISNAIISYGVYIGQVFLPTKLAVLYPYTHPIFIKVVACALLLLAITTAVIWIGRRKKYLLTGWLWYIGTLVPVIGIVQVGSQAHADRYTYIPFVGIFIMLAWGLKAIAEKMPNGKKVAMNVTLGVVFLVMSIKTWDQVGYWKNGLVLFSHSINVTQGSDAAYYNLANMLLQEGRPDEAIVHYQKSLEINPNKIETLSNLAGAYVQTNQPAKAVPFMQRAISLAKAAGDELQVKELSDNLERLNRAMSAQGVQFRESGGK